MLEPRKYARLDHLLFGIWLKNEEKKKIDRHLLFNGYPDVAKKEKEEEDKRSTQRRREDRPSSSFFKNAAKPQQCKEKKKKTDQIGGSDLFSKQKTGRFLLFVKLLRLGTKF